MSIDKQKTPNILIIYADEMRADMMGCSGNPVVRTPYLDRLASEGVRFENAFVSTPLCTPFRASFYTGKYSHSTGVCANHYPIPLRHEFLPEILRANGYQTGYVGKWHLNGGDAPGFVPPGDRRLGFDHLIGFNRGHYYLDSIFYRDSPQPYHCPRYEPDFQTDHLIDLLENFTQDKDNTPFFSVICYGAPHFPFSMPSYFEKLYRPEEMPLGPTSGDVELQRQRTKELMDNGFPRASGLFGLVGAESRDYDDEDTVRSFLAKYYGMVANVDHNVGRILNWLDKKQLTEDTLVIFLSDHGDMAGEQGYRCGTKKTPFRQAMKVPVIIRYPRRFPSDQISESLIDLSVDTMPTLLELCRLKIPKGVQGKSYLSVLDGSSEPYRNAVYYEVCTELEGPERFPIPERGVRTKDWLYVRTRQRPTMLFSLRDDPQELHNLVGDPKCESVISNLEALLVEHMRQTGDDWSAQAVFPPDGFLTHEEKTVKQEELAQRARIEP